MNGGREHARPPGTTFGNSAQVVGWLPLLLVLGFAVLWPLVSLELRSLADGLQSYRAAYLAPGIVRCILLTIALALADVVFALVVGTGLAWCSLHLPRRWQVFGSIVPLMPLLVPSVAAVAGWIFLLSPRAGYLNTVLRMIAPSQEPAGGPLDVYTFAGMVFVSGLIFSSFIFMFVSNGLRNAGAEYEEAASVAGASALRTFWTVTLPQLRPSLAYGAGIVFMLALGQFSAPILLGVPANIDVLTTRMFGMLEGYPIPFGEVAALGTPLLVAGVLVAIVQRWIVGDLRRYVTVGGKAQHSPRGTKSWAITWIGIFGLLAVALPLVALLYAALSPFWTRNLTLGNLTVRHFVAVLTNQNLVNAIRTSVYASAATIAIVLPLGFIAARLLTGRTPAPRAAVRAIDLLLLLPFAVPATLFGFALLFAYSKPPFLLYGTQAIIVIAYATIMMPYATRILLAALVAFGQEPWEASAICGAGPVRTFLRVTLPLMRRSGTVAAVMVFILLFQEFAVSLLVRSASVQVVGSVLYDQYAGGSYPDVAVLALLMVAMTALGVAIMTAVGGSDALRRAAGTR